MIDERSKLDDLLYDPSEPVMFDDSFFCDSSSTPPLSAVDAALGGPVPGPPSSLDAQETTVHDSESVTYRAFLSSGMRPAMAAADQLYDNLDRLQGKKRLEVFRSCRSVAWFVRHAETHEVRIASRRCHLRWCPLCIKVRRYIITEAVKGWIESIAKPKFITFTLRHADKPISWQVDKLYRCFRNFRRLKPVKKRLKGGIWFFQITKNQESGRWHPHLHLVCQSSYISQSYLSDLWLTVTGDSDIVDVRSISDAKKSADYVARYASSPCDLRKLDMTDAVALALALEGRRLYGKFGTASKVQLSPKKCDDWHMWEPLYSFSCVANRKRHEPILSEIWDCWRSGGKCSIGPPDPVPFLSSAEKFGEAVPENCKQLLLF